jgi:hypothetical protein
MGRILFGIHPVRTQILDLDTLHDKVGADWLRGRASMYYVKVKHESRLNHVNHRMA